MKWLPSFVKLFLLFVSGLVLMLGGSIGQMSFFGNYTMSSLFAILHIVGLLLSIVSPLLLGLKFFARLDQKRQ